MRPQLSENPKPQEHQYKRHCPEIKRKRGPLKKPVSLQHTVPEPCGNIVKTGFSLKNRQKPRVGIGKHGFMVHDGSHPDTELEADAHDLRHILKEHINRAGKKSDSQGQQGGSQGIIHQLEPYDRGHPAYNQIHPQT